MLFGVFRIRRALSKSGPEEIISRFGEIARGPLLELLHRDDSELQLRVIATLQMIPNEQVATEFVGLLCTKNIDLYFALAAALVGFGSISISPLSHSLATDQASLRLRIIQVLGELGCPESVSQLINTLSDPDATVRHQAVSALIQANELICGYPTFVELVNVLSDSADPMARECAAKVLGALKSPEAAEPLANAATDTDSRVRLSSIKALAAVGPSDAVTTFLHVLDDTNWEVREAALDGIRKLGNIREAIPAIVSLLSSKNDVAVNNMAHAFLIEICREHPEDLISVMDSCKVTSQTRSSLIRILSQSGNNKPETVAAVSNGLTDEDENVRMAAIESLKKFGSEYVNHLVAAFEDNSLLVQISAIEAVEEIGTINNVRPLTDLLDSPDEIVRQVSFRALKCVGHDHLDEVTELLSSVDTSSRVRVHLIHLLTQLDYTKYRNLILSCKSNSAEEVRLAVINAITTTNDQANEPLIEFFHDNSLTVRRSALAALQTRKAKSAVKPALNLLSTTDDELYIAVKQFITTYGNDNLEFLCTVVSDAGKPSRIRASTIEILGDLGDTTALPIIERSLTDADARIRQAAVNVISAISNSDIDSLKRLKQDPDSAVRAAVDAALRNRAKWDLKEKRIKENERQQALELDRLLKSPGTLAGLVEEGNLELAEQLVQKGANINQRCSKGWAKGMTPVMMAAYMGHTSLLDTMLSSGHATLTITDVRGFTALHCAAFQGKIESIRLLLRHNPPLNAKDTGQQTALHLAAFGGHSDIVQLLLKAGALVNTRDRNGETPIMPAIWNSHNSEIVSMLIKSGVDLSLETNEGSTALSFATQRGLDKIARLIVNAGGR